MRHRLFVAGIVLLMSMICFSMRYVKADTTDSSSIVRTADDEKLKQEAVKVCTLINRQRVSVGESALSFDDRLWQTSSVRATERKRLRKHT